MADLETLVRMIVNVTETQQEATRAQQEALGNVTAAQQETLAKVTAAQQQTNRLQSEQLQEARLERAILMQCMEQLAVNPALTSTVQTIRSTHVLTKMTEGDDVEAYLLPSRSPPPGKLAAQKVDWCPLNLPSWRRPEGLL